ncbi:hypothetical protein UPYG_G00130520 [Umbra pygmaea]|uniref:Cilia- and flagella-associated protein HOATZ n=1 Tax=Umbra pygmaea TaxID=75934 RepID=A0ABD0X6Z1_UMBPY
MEEERGEAEHLTLQTEFDKYFTVFDGSSLQDVSHAKQLWASLSLLPPLESRLVSADIRQRLPVAQTLHDSSAALKQSSSAIKARFQETAHQKIRQEERQRNMDMREHVSVLYQSRQGDRCKRLDISTPENLETDVDEVRRL